MSKRVYLVPLRVSCSPTSIFWWYATRLGDEFLIPVLENTLKEVRLSENEIVVQTPEGLLEV